MTDNKTPDYWRQRAASLPLSPHMWVDGRKIPADGGETFDSINPATGDTLARISVGSAHDADRAVSAARRASDDRRWSGLSPLTRKAILLKLADLIAADAETLALYDTLEMGKTITEALGDVQIASAFFRFYGEAIDKISSPLMPSHESTLAFNLYEPQGVVAAIVPWNFPVINSALKAAPILAAGNALILKPSELASFSTLRLAELALEAGVPDGIFNVVPGLGHTVGAALSEHPDIDMLSFTGSTLTGRKVIMAAGQSNGKRVTIECGGKSPQIIFADMADEIDAVAREAVHEAFQNQGQICVARTRLLVEHKIKDRLLAAIAAITRNLIPGDPLNAQSRCGAIASRPQWQKIRNYIETGIAAGAKPLWPLKPFVEGPGFFMPPVIFDEVTPDMRIAREEIFGPVLSVMSFTTIEEAIHLANDSDYGLAATAWTRDYRVTNQLMRRLQAGKITLRAAPTQSEKAGLALAAEPYKQSGFGVEFGIAGLKTYTRLKAIELIG